MEKVLKICVQSGDWYDDLFGAEKGAAEAVEFIKNCGFDAIDFNIDHGLPGDKIRSRELTDFFDASEEELCSRYSVLKDACEKNDLVINQMHAPFPLYVDGNDKLNEYFIMVIEKCCAVCKYLGCKALVAHPVSFADKEKEIEVNLSLYRRMMPAAKKYGVKICLENMFVGENGHIREGACSTAEESAWYIDKLNAEAGEELFGYCFDVGHATLLGRNIPHYIKTLGSRLTVLHIHDNDSCHDMHMAPYTQRIGYNRLPTTDWDGFCDALKEIDYKGALSFETFSALKFIPHELYEPMLKFIAATGEYFRNKII